MEIDEVFVPMPSRNVQVFLTTCCVSPENLTRRATAARQRLTCIKARLVAFWHAVDGGKTDDYSTLYRRYSAGHLRSPVPGQGCGLQSSFGGDAQILRRLADRMRTDCRAPWRDMRDTYSHAGP